MAACLLGASASGAEPAQDAAPALDGVSPHIHAVLHDPAVSQRIAEWGLTTADVQHDVDALSPAERARLAYILTRRWRGNASHSEADLQAQFLVMMSLMRESTLFASIVSTNSLKLR